MRRCDSSEKVNRQDLGDILREIFRAADWRLIHDAGRDFELHRSRWTLDALILQALLMALSSSRALKDRFAEVRAVLAALRPKRRQSGKTAEGYLAALSGLPLAVVGTLRERLQDYVQRHRLAPARVGRFQAFGLDSTKQNMPLTTANLAHFGSATKAPPRPQRLVLTAVALGTRMVWDWAVGLADGSERALAAEVGARLPREALLVCDAGFVGYDHLRQARERGQHFLVRVGANGRLLTRDGWRHRREGQRVWLWPQEQQKQTPLELRLICVRRPVRRKLRRRKGQHRRVVVHHEELWLLTDLLDPAALTSAEAQELYALRWPGSEVGFRQWKHTLEAECVRGRTPAEVEREADFSMLALMALHASVLVAQGTPEHGLRVPSIAESRRTWLAAGRATLAGRRGRGCVRALAACVLDEYVRSSAKTKRRWARRKPHRPFRRPHLRKMSKDLYAKGCKALERLTA